MLGRYVIVGVLGRGGMGVVYSAYDPELDRRVAIKLLRPGVGMGGTTRGRSRLVREAQAMAKLSHRNVVAVHDVGEIDQSVFVAMEFVDGQTLTQWLEDDEGATRAWHAVLAMFMQAGHGLQAAHHAGLVHRDFKPDNVMVSVDGRAVVLDFGLARGEYESSPDDDAPTEAVGPQASTRALHERLTATGSLMGTPAYMSPEQFAGNATDARTDQFSFCVALYGALYGQAPFAGETVAQLTRSVLQDDVSPAPRGTGVPSWVRQAVVRGMARDVDARYTSMAQLLEALGRDPKQRRRRWLVGGGVAAVLGGGVLWGQSLADEADPCASVEAALDEAWGAGRREATQERFTASGAEAAAETWERVATSLDTHAKAWRATGRTVCEAARSRDPDEAAVAAMQTRCLDASLLQIDAATRVLAQADRDVVGRAVDIASSVWDPSLCLEPENYRTVVPIPEDPELRQQVAEVRELLASVSATVLAGRGIEARETIGVALIEARDTGYGPVMAEALALQAHTFIATGMVDEALEAHQEAVRMALGQSRDFLAAGVLAEAAVANSAYRSEQNLALWQLDMAFELAQRTEAPRLIAKVDAATAVVLSRGGDESVLDKARLRGERAVASFKALGDRGRAVDTLVTLSSIHFLREDTPAVRAVLLEALELSKDVYGPRHPQAATIQAQLARVYAEEGEHDRAVEMLRNAHAVFRETVGDAHVNTMATANGLGLALVASGHMDEGIVFAERAYAIGGRMFPEPHQQLDLVRNNYASSLRVAGRAAEALPLLRQSVADATGRDGPTGYTTRVSENLLADTLRVAGELDAAERSYNALIAARRQGAKDWLVRPLAGLALTTLALGKHPAALAHAREAVALSEGEAEDGHANRYPLFVLAYVLRKSSDIAGAEALYDALDVAFAGPLAQDMLARSYRAWRSGKDVPPNR